jgi:hypothetical protein
MGDDAVRLLPEPEQAAPPALVGPVLAPLLGAGAARLTGLFAVDQDGGDGVLISLRPGEERRPLDALVDAVVQESPVADVPADPKRIGWISDSSFRSIATT